jgi:hypothetical protein
VPTIQAAHTGRWWARREGCAFAHPTNFELFSPRVLPAHQMRRRISPLQRGDVRERLVVVHRLFHAHAVFPQASGLFPARLRWEMKVSIHARSAAASLAAYEGDEKRAAPSVANAAAILKECNIERAQLSLGWVECPRQLKLDGRRRTIVTTAPRDGFRNGSANPVCFVLCARSLLGLRRGPGSFCAIW